MPRSGAERRERLLHHLYGCDYASIGELVVLLGASEATLRRDLAQLETEGFLRRSHGGARMVSGSDERVAFELRERDNLEAKRAIADAAWQLIESGSTILLDSGTTVMQLARRLRIDPLPSPFSRTGSKSHKSSPGCQALMSACSVAGCARRTFASTGRLPKRCSIVSGSTICLSEQALLATT